MSNHRDELGVKDFLQRPPPGIRLRREGLQIVAEIDPQRITQDPDGSPVIRLSGSEASHMVRVLADWNQALAFERGIGRF